MSTNPRPQIFLRVLLAASFTLALSSFPARAVDYTWSPGGVFGVAGSGTWSTSVANWSEDGTTFVNWQNAQTNRAVFQGADGNLDQYVVSIAGSYNVQALTFNASGYVLEGIGSQRTLSLSSSGISVASGKIATIGNLARLSHGNANLSGGGTLRVATGGALSGNAGLGVSGSSTLHIDGGDATYVNFSHGSGINTTTISSGTMNVTNNTIANGNGFVLADSAGSTSTLNLDGGTLNTVRIYRRTGTGNVNFNGGTFQLRSSAAETAATSFLSANNAFVEEGGAIIDSNGFDGFTSQVFQHGGVAATDGGLTKNGAGRITLSGTSTYTGTTTVNAGTLLINGRLTATSAVTVSSTATLGGTGLIDAAVTVSGTLAPGASIESLGAGEVSFENGSSLAVELDSSAAAGLQSDLLVAAGNLNLDGEVTLTLTNIAALPVAFANGTTFSLVNYSGTWDGGLFTVGGNAIADGGTFTVGLNTWQLNYADVTGGSNFTGDYLPDSDFVNIVAVPEPAAVALLTGGLCAVMFFGRNRRRLSSDNQSL